MKNIMKTATMTVILTILLASCSQDWLDVNTDPNNPSEATVDLVFPAATMSSGSQIGGYYNIIGNLWSQFYTQSNTASQYELWDACAMSTLDFNGPFQELYAGCLNDMRYVKEKSVETEDWSYYLMATVMEAFTFQMLADAYDQVPFSQANKGEIGISEPEYETGQAIYDSLIVRINFALDKFNSANDLRDPGTTDFVFGGEMERWVEFANTLKLKIYMRQSYARPSVAQAGIEGLYNANAAFLSTDAALTQFIDAPSNSNPMYESDQRQLNTRTNLRASRTFMSYLNLHSDPRIDELFIPGNAGHNSMIQGTFDYSTTQLDPNTISRALLNAVDPVYFISEAESYFLQAEAVLRGWGSGDVKALYDAGVEAAFARFDLDGSDFVEAGGEYEFPAAGTLEEKLEAIMIQKWASMARSQGLEAFFERNRTGYPRYSTVGADNPAYVPGQLTYPIAGTTNGQFPKRFLFTDFEQSRNSNCPDEVPVTTRVWWDTNR